MKSKYSLINGNYIKINNENVTVNLNDTKIIKFFAVINFFKDKINIYTENNRVKKNFYRFL
jgi:hypothetical protein